ncbi:MAG: ABC transporter ATP-binding protein, partial [Turicibacter sp.]
MVVMKKPMIEFVDFSFQYDAQAKPTLQNINLTIYEGEKVLIVGPSGSGKSTIAHCINGLVPNIYKGIASGLLKIDGREALADSIFTRSNSVGTVLQNPDDQFIGLTVGEDVAFKLENLNVSQVDIYEKVKAIAKLVDIETYLKQSPHDLSGGQKQRVTLGGVLVDDIQILLFDEPLANLDPAAGKQAIELIDSIQTRTRKTSIIIEHRLEDVLYRCIDRVIVVSQGRIVADMSPNEILASTILEEVGIREPLYITALKYAGCDVTEAMQLDHIDQILLDEAAPKLVSWYEGATPTRAPLLGDRLLEFNQVSYEYRQGEPTLSNLSFAIHKGEMVSLVGKNGAGKSTLSKLVVGFIKPTAGCIKWKGQDIVDETIKERAQKIGLVMQNPNQMISKTMIFDEVALGLRVAGIDELQVVERVNETLKI